MNAKLAYQLSFFTYMALLLYAIIDNIMKGYTHSIAMSFVSLLLVFVPHVLFRILKLKPVYQIYTLYVIFITLASLLGSSYRFYDHYAYWDKFTHMLSGVLGVLFAYVLFCSLKRVHLVSKKDIPIMLIFVQAVNIAIAALWEQYEYLCLILADYDAIRHYSTGVHDSMSDITVCILGGIIATYAIWRRYKYNKPNFFTNIYEEYYKLNMQKDKSL